MKAIEALTSVLCDPEGKCCISGSDDDRRLIDSALAELAKAAQPAPVLWVSPEQFANFMDADEAPFGKYVPARKTSAGNFTMPLFAASAPAPAQQAAQQGAAYAALPDEGEPWRGHKFKEVQRGCWRCDCGKTIKEVTSDQSTPASGGNYPVMPKRYTVDDDGEELFTAEKMRSFADATHTLRASHGQAPAQTADSQLLQFYGVTTDAELIAAQAAHIEKLQAKLTKTPSFAPQRVREG